MFVELAAFQSKLMNFRLVQSRKTTIQMNFYTNKWTSEIGDNSALIHGPFHRNRETRKTTTLTIDRTIHMQAEPEALDNISCTGEETTIVFNQQSTRAQLRRIFAVVGTPSDPLLVRIACSQSSCACTPSTPGHPCQLPAGAAPLSTQSTPSAAPSLASSPPPAMCMQRCVNPHSGNCNIFRGVARNGDIFRQQQREMS